MKPFKDYTIQFVGLKVGKHHFDYQIDNKFFEYFEYEEYNDVNIDVDLLFEKKTTFLELNFKAKGVVNVNCDTTNEPYDQKIKGEFDLVVKFGEEYNDENEDILIIPHGEYEINVAQYIYELIILSMPTKRVHPGIADGTLQSDILKKLEELSPKGLEEKEKTEDIDPRWNTLKKLLTDK
ncbi:MAG: YceD family protein [Aquaticitalea sp.]